MGAHERKSAAQSLSNHVLGLIPVAKANNIALFASTDLEISTHVLFETLKSTGKNVYFPKVQNDQLIFYEVQSMQSMKPGRFSILEPDSKFSIELFKLDVLLIPALAVDEGGHRLGRGGGYYDKTIAMLHDNQRTVALVYEAQIIENVPVSHHDQKVDCIVSEKRVIRLHENFNDR